MGSYCRFGVDLSLVENGLKFGGALVQSPSTPTTDALTAPLYGPAAGI